MSENNNSSEEIWRDIAGYEGRYMVSSWGNIKSLYGRGRILRPKINKKGYSEVNLRLNSNQKSFRIHRLVAQTFLPNPSNLPCVNHINEDKTNNNVENLEWVTYLQNNNWGTRPEKLRQKLIGNTFSRKGAAERKRAVVQLSKDGKYIATFDSAHAAARAVTGTSDGNSHIIYCCQRKRPNAYGFVWRYVDENGGGKKPVALVDEDGNILRRFPSVCQAAQDLGIPQMSIFGCCTGHAKTTHGMRFVYLDRNTP